ncbi:MAG: hypothetical protein J6M12_07185 [Clostridia bacterium]|nr:hypothetical protein [Clostridia bacterium]
MKTFQKIAALLCALLLLLTIFASCTKEKKTSDQPMGESPLPSESLVSEESAPAPSLAPPAKNPSSSGLQVGENGSLPVVDW